MNSTASLITKIVLLLGIIFLGYKLYAIIQEPITFQKLKDKRYEKTEHRLEEIRDAQKAYRTEYNTFAKDFDQLIAFIDTGKQSIIERKDSSFKKYDQVYQQEREHDTVITKVIGYKNVKESLFDKDFDASKLRYIPYTDNVPFEMETGKIKVSEVVVPVMEVRAPNKKIFADVWNKYYQYIDPDYVLKVGSLSEPTLNGNWK